MIKKIAVLLMIFSMLTIVFSLLIVSFKIYTVSDMVSHKDRYLKSDLKETPYRKGFNNGYYYGSLYGGVFAVMVLVLVIVNNLNISVRIINYMKRNNLPQLKKSLRLSCIPIVSPFFLAGIPLAVLLMYLIRKNELETGN
jgi:hypothetical protein